MDNVTHIVRQFNWRFMLVRLVANALTLLIIVLLVPKIYFVDRTIPNLIFMSLMLGIFNVVFRPIIQFLTLPLLFATFGLIIGLINAAILLMLTWFFPDRFAVTSLFWVIIAGVLMGIISTSIESLLGLTRPILPDGRPELVAEVDERDPHLFRKYLDAIEDERRESVGPELAEPVPPVAEDTSAVLNAAPAQAREEVVARPATDLQTSDEPQATDKQEQQEDDHADSNA